MYDVPGVAIALVTKDKVAYARGYGTRDAAGDPVTADTVFGIGSLTKPFTALDVALLADEGRIDLDAPVRRYLPDFRLSDPEATRTLTVRQVISHASGLPRSDAFWAYGDPADRKAIIDDMANIPLRKARRRVAVRQPELRAGRVPRGADHGAKLGGFHPPADPPADGHGKRQLQRP
jgi:CubicO group peptidase (beta-lactamase class C family)